MRARLQNFSLLTQIFSVDSCYVEYCVKGKFNIKNEWVTKKGDDNGFKHETFYLFS